MPFFNETNHHQQQIIHSQAEQNLVQAPKIIIQQQGPSPFSYSSKQSRAISQFSSNINENDSIGTSKVQIINVNVPLKPKTSTIQLTQPHHQLIFMEKPPIEDQQIQIYQTNTTNSNGNLTAETSLPSIYNSSENLIDNINNHINNNQHFNDPDPDQSAINLINPTGSQNQTLPAPRNYATTKRKNITQNNPQQRISSDATALSSVVPTLTNVDEIFHLLSQKIAKYCQVLADLTNCEVFYKAQLQQAASEGQVLANKSSKKSRYNSASNNYHSRSHRNNQIKKRSLYWGTHQMLFQYSHNQGLKYDKNGGDSLIKLNQRSISTDVTNLIEEIMNAPSIQNQDEILDLKNGKRATGVSNGSTEHTEKLNQQNTIVNTSLENGDSNSLIKSTVQLIDTGDIEVIDLETAEKVINSDTIRMNATQDTTCLSETTFNLINELNRNVESEFFKELKITSSSTDYQSIQLNNASCSHLKDKCEGYKANSNQVLKECCVFLNRLDDSIIDAYLNKFEMKYNNGASDYMLGEDIIDEPTGGDSSDQQFSMNLNLNEFPCDDELYTDEFPLDQHKNQSNCKYSSNDNEEEDDFDDCDSDDERKLLEKNCLNTSDINESSEDFYTCELCPNNAGTTPPSYKHLPQLKIHQLRSHENVSLATDYPFDCNRCGLRNIPNRIAYLKHLLACFYPLAYNCKTCGQIFENYAQYLFHTRFIHTPVLYMCVICSRKFKHIKDLLDHDQFMHLKTMNYCEICFEGQKSRKNLYEHYIQVHVNYSGNNQCRSSNDVSFEFQDMDESESNLLNRDENMSTATNNLVKTLDDGAGGYDDDDPTKSKDKQINWGKVQKNDLIRGLLDRKHQCKWCSLRFYTKSQLKQHETTHANSVLVCPVCDKQFVHKDRLSGHMKCHMEPSLECKVCGKKFKRLCNLYNHELVHGLTEHAFMLCQFCGRGFRSRRDYQNHVIANHRDQLMKADNGSQGQEVNCVEGIKAGHRRVATSGKKTRQQIQAQSFLSSIINNEADCQLTNEEFYGDFHNLDEESQQSGNGRGNEILRQMGGGNGMR